ncbi:hypothetical protein HORIV_40590 [Vreelandella olivaria]|uniref:CobN/magnesium chelatase domain-containing protein n=1 Tax=Vreelandella olivaria TaxID=390919 RepID=A0ABN5WXG2_9GAMM|nr:hypothetical protein HORIV_40590 [Halomonas olivaria]
MIAGIRLGDTFVGIQPERDFIDDLTQSYHDMQLAPPHSYLAFYFLAARALSGRCGYPCGQARQFRVAAG